ncbi:sensor histidine kinase [Nocardia sp. NPDC052566]|uniref:sensor histidine kinase n=1 Tax=Nocardia sp. NPDC052566 TaxID=3364330 RepID=UPI0037C6E494
MTWSPRILLASLRGRILAATISVACVTAIATGGALAVKARSWAYESAQEAVFAEFHRNIRDLFESGHATDLAELPAEYTVTVDGLVVRQGDARIDDISPGLRGKLDHSSGLYLFERLPGQRVAVGYAAPGRQAAPGGHITVYAVRNLAGVPEKQRQLAWIIALSVLGSAALGGVLGFALTASLVRPIRRIAAAARRVPDGDVLLPSTDIAELRDVTTTFNDMVRRQRETIRGLVEQDERARRFVSDVAHELRSPLAALVPAAEVLAEELADRDGDAGTAARLIGAGIDDLARLVEDLLEMSQRDSGRAVLLSETVDLVELIDRTLRLRGWSDQVTVVVEPGARRFVGSDPRRIEAIVSNLVGNALRHGRPPVSVAVRRADAAARIEVGDAGDGIPAEHVDRVFERMYKVSESRTRTGGAGLGLAIAKENAQLLGGDLTYRRDAGRTVFSVDLPMR